MNIIKFLPTLPQYLTLLKSQYPRLITMPSSISSTISTTIIDMNTLINDNLGILFMNRNARVPKRANHGARPCSSVMRR